MVRDRFISLSGEKIFLYNKTFRSGIEPESSARQAEILTTVLSKLLSKPLFRERDSYFSCLLKKEKDRAHVFLAI